MVTLVQHAPGLWLAETDLDLFPVRCAVLVGSERAALWDALAHPRHLAAFKPLLKSMAFDAVYSHADWDHVWGAGGLEDLGGPQHIVAHPAAALRFERELPGELARMQADEPGKWDAVMLLPPTRIVDGPLRLDLGGLSLDLSPLPGHTPDSMVGLVEELSVLLAGDVVEWPLPSLQEHSPLDAWLDGLARWEGDPRVSQVVPAHGPLGGKELIRATSAYLRDLQAGRAPAVPKDLSPFYAATHRDNLRFTGLA